MILPLHQECETIMLVIVEALAVIVGRILRNQAARGARDQEAARAEGLYGPSCMGLGLKVQGSTNTKTQVDESLMVLLLELLAHSLFSIRKRGQSI